MKDDIFTTADILLPNGISPEKWSVIACDQFSSELDYWERVRDYVDSEPSTLNMIIPEAYLNGINIEQKANDIRMEMERCINGSALREVKDSFVYVERTLTDGRIRRGLVGAVNLDDYDFTSSSASVLASEGTVLDRLPARINVRRAVPLELPHIMAFIDDAGNTVIEPIADKAAKHALPLLYDFELMEQGGHIRGFRVSGKDANAVLDSLRDLHRDNDTLMVIGDGNHSLAAAKVFWDEIKTGLGSSEYKTHLSGKALLEVNNVYDPAISFEAIHRVVFDADNADLLQAFSKAMPKGNDYELCWLSQGETGIIGVSATCIGDMLAAVQEFIDDYVNKTGCLVDYIHGEDAVRKLALERGCFGLILPSMDKSELFATVKNSGVFPKKSFSVGHARDKRYYLECRRIS